MSLPCPALVLPRTTNFFIDNILRPDFGCRKDGTQTPPGRREHVHPRLASRDAVARLGVLHALLGPALIRAED
ncbi:hypothetical protein NHX12_014531, partial [Muraenolepis orangiensis]